MYFDLVASEQYEEITDSPDAWTLVEVSEGASVEDSENVLERSRDYKPTVGARQVRALVEQVAGELKWKLGPLSVTHSDLMLLHSRSIRIITHAPA